MKRISDWLVKPEATSTKDLAAQVRLYHSELRHMHMHVSGLVRTPFLDRRHVESEAPQGTQVTLYVCFASAHAGSQAAGCSEAETGSRGEGKGKAGSEEGEGWGRQGSQGDAGQGCQGAACLCTELRIILV